MKRTFTILTVFLLIGCVGSTDKKKEESKNDNSKFLEVYEEPMHKLVFEKDELKIRSGAFGESALKSRSLFGGIWCITEY